MLPNHELYRMEHEERLRKAREHQWLTELPIKQNWLAYALNQLRLFLF